MSRRLGFLVAMEQQCTVKIDILLLSAHMSVMRLHFHRINSKVRLRLLLTPLQNKMRIKRIRPLCVVRASPPPQQRCISGGLGYLRARAVEPLCSYLCFTNSIPSHLQKESKYWTQELFSKGQTQFYFNPLSAGCQQAVDRSI